MAHEIPPALAERLLPGYDREIRRVRLHIGRFARLLTWVAGANAIVFGRRVFLAASAEQAMAADAAAAARFLAHELTHVRQYRRYGMAAFLGRYVGEYLSARFAGASHREAYLAISFELEAESASATASPTRPGGGACPGTGDRSARDRRTDRPSAGP